MYLRRGKKPPHRQRRREKRERETAEGTLGNTKVREEGRGGGDPPWWSLAAFGRAIQEQTDVHRGTAGSGAPRPKQSKGVRRKEQQRGTDTY